MRAGLVATLATAGARTRILWHIHDDLPRHPISSTIRTLAHRSRRSSFVAVSEATAQAFAGTLDFGPRMHVLHNGIDTSRFPARTIPPDPAAQSIREELGLDASDFLVVTVGMINPRKGLLPLIDTFADVEDRLRRLRRKPANLAIAGAPIFNKDHLYEAALHARAEELELTSHVHFLGPRRDVPAILRAADLFVLNSTAEPFCLILLECIAARTPILASRVGGVPELLEDGVSGRLVAPPTDRRVEDGDSLSSRLLESVTDPYSLVPLAEHAYRHVLPRFTLQAFAANLQALYTRMEL